MKKQHIHPFLLVTAVFLAFLLGFAAGRNYNHADVQVSVIPADSLRAAETSAISATSPLSILPIAAVSESVPVSEPNTESQTIIPADIPETVMPTEAPVPEPPVTEETSAAVQPEQQVTEASTVETEAPAVTEAPAMTEEPVVTDPVVISTEPKAPEPTEKTPSSGETAGLININTASAAQLETLPGIGAVIAQRIVDYRNTYGPFQSVGALINVKGIGEKRLAAIINLVTI